MNRNQDRRRNGTPAVTIKQQVRGALAVSSLLLLGLTACGNGLASNNSAAVSGTTQSTSAARSPSPIAKDNRAADQAAEAAAARAAAKTAAEKAAAKAAADKAAAKAAAQKAAKQAAQQAAAKKAAEAAAAVEAAKAAAAEQAAQQALLEPPAPPAAASSNCDPNYSGACVPIASDVDCAGGSGNGPAYVQGPVTVTGSDIYGLDRNNDGVGCEG